MAQHSFGRANQLFTVADWRSLFGGEPGIIGDVDGSAYKLTLPTGTDNAQLGSTTQDSTSIVAGALHQIVQGQVQEVEVPGSSNAATGRTDILGVRYDAATFTSDPGPCRVYRIPGVEGSAALPAMDEAPPGVEDMPLYAITRKQGQSLNQATVRDLRRRSGPNLLVPAGEALPTNVPLGSAAVRAGIRFRRDFNTSGTPEWAFDTTSRRIAQAELSEAGTGSIGSDEAGILSVGSAAVGLGGVRATFTGVVSGSVGHLLRIRIRANGIEIGRAQHYVPATGGPGQVTMSFTTRRLALSPGTYSFDVRAQRLSGPAASLIVMGGAHCAIDETV